MLSPSCTDRPGVRSAFRAAGCAALLALLAACATPQGTADGADANAPRLAALYAAHARGTYVPPGPPEDPWGPYIRQAAAKFDMPEAWVRAVMHVESNGQEYQNGQLITSPVGAMGLMQVMPGTYEELRDRYGLSADPFDPHDNILAGVAYMREMYDIYGAPGFLAAYNAGPNRLDDYLSNNRPLPAETRRYVAMIGPELAGASPVHRSPAEAYAMNDLPLNIGPGLRYGGGRTIMVAAKTSRHAPARHGSGHHSVEVARLSPTPRTERAAAVTRVAMVISPSTPPEPARHSHGFHLISRAEAAPAPLRAGGSATGSWGIQVGAYASQTQAQHAVGAAKAGAHGVLSGSHPVVASVHQGHGLLWRARLTGLSKDAAVEACGKLAHSHTGCLVVSPESQS
jgi:hypothetical protein